MMEDGRLKMEDGKWIMDYAIWNMEYGIWTMKYVKLWKMKNDERKKDGRWNL